MKNLLKTLCLLPLFFALSCDDEPVKTPEGTLQFSVDTKKLSGGRTLGTPHSIIVSVNNATGAPVLVHEFISLVNFSGEFLSEPIALATGEYTLTEFIVVDENQNAIYATPVAGSPLAHLVDHPLPVNISISENNVTKTSTQVVKVEGHSGAEFGYATFSFEVVPTFGFKIGVLAYNSTTTNFELTSSHILIENGSDVLYDSDIAAATKRIVVIDELAEYNLTVSKSGFQSYSRTFTASQLKAFDASPLVVSLLAGSLAEGLIAYYPFNGNANDATVNHLNGVVSGAALAADRKGITNSAYSFDGINDVISVADNSLLDFAADQNFSISVWTYIDPNQSAEGGINDIIRKWVGDHQGYPFSISFGNQFAANPANHNTIVLARYNGQACANSTLGFSQVISFSQFHHIVQVKENGMIKVYIDNQLNTSFPDNVVESASCSTTNDSPMTFGARGQLARFFKGKIDDIRIYNRALSAVEVSNLYGE